MGLIAKIIDSFKNNGESSAKVELYKNDNANARIFNPSGVDARPLDNDFCFTEDSEDTEGGKDVLGFIDPKNQPVAEKGEHRTYARDADGNIVATLHLKKDGTIQIDTDKDLIANIAGNLTATVASGKKISFGNGTDELLSLLNDNLTEVIKGLKYFRDSSTYSNGGGPTGPPSNGALLSPIITNLETTQAALGNIKV